AMVATIPCPSALSEPLERLPVPADRQGVAPVQRERDLAEGRAIATVWTWFVHNQNKHDVPFSTIVLKVRAQCSSVTVERIQMEFARRTRRALQLGRWG